MELVNHMECGPLLIHLVQLKINMQTFKILDVARTVFIRHAVCPGSHVSVHSANKIGSMYTGRNLVATQS